MDRLEKSYSLQPVLYIQSVLIRLLYNVPMKARNLKGNFVMEVKPLSVVTFQKRTEALLIKRKVKCNYCQRYGMKWRFSCSDEALITENLPRI